MKKSEKIILAEMRFDIAAAVEKIIRKYEKKYGIQIERNIIPEFQNRSRIEYPEKNMF